MPGEPDIARRLDGMKALKARYGCEVVASPVYVEPGSPWIAFPDMYGEHAVPHMGFDAFWEQWQEPLDHWNPDLTYNLPDLQRVTERVLGELSADSLKDFDDSAA